MPSSAPKRRSLPPPPPTPASPPGSRKKPKLSQEPQPQESILDAAFKSCASLLERLLGHEHGWVFSAPVDARRLGLRDYYADIREPMDLGTVGNRIRKGRYSSPLDFSHDVRLTFANAMRYNDPGDEAYGYAEELMRMFDEAWGEIEATLRPAVVSDGEKRRVRDDVQRLPQDRAEELVGMIRGMRSSCLRIVKGMAEVDFDKMDLETFLEVDAFVDACLRPTTRVVGNGVHADSSGSGVKLEC